MRISDWSSDVCSSDLLALADSPGALDGEPALMAAAGLTYVHIPVPFGAPDESHFSAFAERSEERRGGKECVVRVDLGGRRIIKKKKIHKCIRRVHRDA